MSGNKEDKQQVKFKQVLNQDQAIAYLNDLITSIKAGTITVSGGDTAMTLQTSPMVELEVKATIKPGKHKLDVELEWIPGSGTGESPSFTISPSDPEQGQP